MNEKLFLRNVSKEDLELTYEWANDKAVRENSFQSHTITKEEHYKWFTEKIKSESTLFYILMNEGIPVGQIRMELEMDAAYVNYSIAREWRGKGYGKQLIHMAEEKIKIEYPNIKKIKAEVKSINLSSKRVFEDNRYNEIFVIYEKILGG